ncbi:MAG: GMC family oxidoreductase N-terminal domain-containing protein [Deltaproteobacteria bacterium]|nr:GMC family oxidoreductase N-terminal domain-containing protein [Deltaproteobacteria bacterium]
MKVRSEVLQMSQSYDTIIVGAGSSGCVLATRLSEDPSHRVLLLEAGPDYLERDLPDELARTGMAASWPHEWGEQVESVRGRRLPYLRGRGIGGSSSTNGCVAIRPEPADFESWPRGWQWADVLPSFRRAEHDLDFPDAPWHGDSGPIPVLRAPQDDWSPLQSAFYEACLKLGFPECPDHNAPETTGVGPIPMNCIDQRRMSCAVTYLEPARDRSNLEIRGDAHARRILVEAGRAVGVLLVDGRVFRANQVVASCGILQSPLLLCRSGIGPADQLRSLDIEPIVDAPALGSNWTDHMAVTFATPIDPALVQRGGLGLQTILRTTSESSQRSHDLQITPHTSQTPDGGVELGVSVSMQQPVGAARIAAVSADPNARVQIDWPFAGEPHNIERIRWGWRTMARIVEESGVSGDPDGVRRSGAMTDAQLDEHIALEHTAFYHGVGSCAMGESEDSVVDSACRVRGIEGLRVVDTSVVPSVPRSNTNLLAVALAERVAELMLER